MVNNENKLEFWSISTSDMLTKLQTTTDDLKSSEVSDVLIGMELIFLNQKNDQTPSKSCFPNLRVQLLLFSFLHPDFLFSR